MGYLDVLLPGVKQTAELTEAGKDWLVDVLDREDSGQSSSAFDIALGPISDCLSNSVSQKSNAQQCCPIFQMVGEFIFNTQTGKVWKYDNNSNSFIGVPKKPTQARYEAIEIRSKRVKSLIQAGIKDVVSKLPPTSQRAENIKLNEKYIKPIDNYLKAIKP